MTNRSLRIKPLIEKAESKRDEVASDFAAQRRLLETEQSRLKSLERYRDEYTLSQPSQKMLMTPALMANRQGFIDSLDAAVKEQSQAIEFKEQAVEAVREKLIEAQRSALVLQKLMANYQSDERMKEQRNEQKLLDEVAGRSRPSTLPNQGIDK